MAETVMLLDEAEAVDHKALIDVLLRDLQHGAVLGHLEKLGVHRVAQLGVALEEADGVLLGGDGLIQDHIVALVAGDLELGDAEVGGDGVHAALLELHEAGVIVRQLHDLLEGGLERLVGVDSVHGRGGSLRHHALAGEVGEVEAHVYGGTFKSASKVAILVGNDNTGGDGGIEGDPLG